MMDVAVLFKDLSVNRRFDVDILREFFYLLIRRM